MAANPGYLATLIIGATTMHATRFTVAWKVDEFDVTTFANYGGGQYASGISDWDLSFDAFYDTSDNPFSNAVNIVPGAQLAVRVQFNRNLGNNPGWYFPNVLFLTVNNDSSVRDVIRYSVTAKASILTQIQANNLVIPAV